MSVNVPSPLAVLSATSKEPSSSVSRTRPLLAALSVGSTKTWNVDVDVAEPALPATTAAVTKTETSAAAMRLLVPPLA
jgi:hypothetical protein